MKDWFNTYKDLMRRTRWVSRVGAALVLLQIAREFLSVNSNIASLGTPLSDGQLAFVIRDFSLGTLIVLALGFRLWLLGTKDSSKYWRIAVSWWLTAIPLWIYYARNSELFEPQCIPEPDMACFAFYDMRGADQIEVAASLFILLSIVRALATTLGAILMSKARLK
jgi:hypothetical protein